MRERDDDTRRKEKDRVELPKHKSGGIHMEF